VNESQIFTHALKLATPAERAAFLDGACAGNAELRENVERLLRAHANDPGFLEPPAMAAMAQESIEEESATCPDPEVPVESTAAEPPPTEGPDIVIAGRYKLIERIGEGGMGTVWMAQQQEPVKRLVAVKLIKSGMDSRAVLARFEAERQALAIMDHPNIAKVYDAGTSGGSPFFVMELVKGVPITKYCDENRLTPRQRLELFVPVCQAIQHAHQKGIIHRDIKPSNVLIARYDDRPVPKVIDFGVAKATGQRLSEHSAHTGFGAVIGTVEYMSPEQASFNQLDVDTRSDIYSLGVLLYELLTGTPPFTRKELEHAGVMEMLRLIREEEPSKPSAKLSSAETLPALAAKRGTEPKRLTKLVRGELDWIVMKALEKDRSRRYESASGLAVDIQRYLTDEPVQAGPPSAWYRMRKFARRHKLVLTTSSLVAATLVVGIVVSTWQAVRATRAEHHAQQQQGIAEANFRHALRAVDRYFNQVSNSPELRAEGLERLRQDLLRTAKEFYDKFVEERGDDPTLRVELGTAHLELGDIAEVLGSSAEALRHYEAAATIFGSLIQEADGNPGALRGLASSHNGQGTVLRRLRQWDKAEASHEQAIALRERLVADHPNNAIFRMDLAGAYNDLGILLGDRERSADAEKAHQKAVTIVERLVAQHPDILRYRITLAKDLRNLGLLCSKNGRYPEAEQYYDKVLPLAQRLYQDHPRDPQCLDTLAVCHNDLGIVYWNTQRLAEAEKAYQEAIRLQQQLARIHPLVMLYQRNLAQQWLYLAALYHTSKRWAEAEPAYHQALTIFDRLVRDFPDALHHQRDLAAVYGNLGELELERGRPALALEWSAKGRPLLEGVLRRDPGEPVARTFLRNDFQRSASAFTKLGRHQESISAWNRAVELAEGAKRTQNRLSRAFARVRAEQYVEAIAEANALAEEQEATRETLYGAACVHSLVSAALPGQAELAERHAARAVVLVRRAAKLGSISANHVRNEEDFVSLRQRPDFQELLKELEAMAKETPEPSRP
jgi:serine/threonine protein kinase/tetratricopeptide (TPR) repeat protein